MNRLMRMLVFFDLPTKTKSQRAAASKFRTFLLQDGYHMMQLSVYTRTCRDINAVAVHKERLNAALPPRGSIRLLVITEKQFNNIDILLSAKPEEDDILLCEQLMIF